jgi:hypothetical protein
MKPKLWSKQHQKVKRLVDVLRVADVAAAPVAVVTVDAEAVMAIVAVVTISVARALMMAAKN